MIGRVFIPIVLASDNEEIYKHASSGPTLASDHSTVAVAFVGLVLSALKPSIYARGTPQYYAT